MSVRPTYLVVEKLVNYKNIVTSQNYINEYQICKVIDCHPDSGLNPNEEILVGNKIFFDSAKDIGEGRFFIFLEEVYGVLRNDTIVPMEDFVYIETDKDRKSIIKKGSVELFNDTSYNPLDKDNVVQDGTVLSVCTKAKDSYFGFPLNVDIKPGDHIYTHHFLTDSDNERKFNGKTYYEIRYENLYCRISDGKIIMLNDWNFVTPVVDETKISETGIVLDYKQKNKLRVGIINHTCQSLIEKGLEVGDMVFFKQGREYEIDVEGTTYYRIHTNDIIYKL